MIIVSSVLIAIFVMWAFLTTSQIINCVINIKDYNPVFDALVLSVLAGFISYTLQA